MNMEELPEFVFDDEKDITKNEDQIAQNNDDSPKKKVNKKK